MFLSGGVDWKSFSLSSQGDLTDDSPSWMKEEYEVHYRDAREVVLSMVENPEFARDIDFSPYREYDKQGKNRRIQHFMSGDWAWRQAVRYFHHWQSQPES